MKKAHQYLVSKGKVPSSEQSFKHKLYGLWFKVSSLSLSLVGENCIRSFV